MTSLITFGVFIWIYTDFVVGVPSTCANCLKSKTCNPPNCFCCRDDLVFSNITLSQIPQMVFFTFDDAVTEQASRFYKRLFQPQRLNPNGCPILMTLFISHDNTKYGLVSDFHKMGMEIAAHSVTHSTMNSSNFFQEAKLQKENLAKLAGIPINDITGWRSPFLQPTGDLQPNTLQKLGYSYDATLTFSKRSFREKPPGPFTLDFGYPYECQVKPCPKQKHPGFWEVPIVSLMDYKQAYDCVYVDGCMNAPPDEESAYQFLWDNFHNYYSTTRMPFGINMHPSWFYYKDRLKAMDTFIKKLVSLNDVYILSANKVLEWLKNPTALQNLHSFKPWACDGTENEFDTKPLLVKDNIKQSLPSRPVSWWTPIDAHDQTLYTQAPPGIQQENAQTRVSWSDTISNRGDILPKVSKPKVKIFLDLSDLQWRSRTEWSTDPQEKDVPSRSPNQNERLQTLQNIKLPVHNALTQRELHELQEERKQQLRAQGALERQQEIITEGHRQQRELLKIYQPEIRALNREIILQSSDLARAVGADARLQQIMRELPLVVRNFRVSKDNVTDAQREKFNERLAQDFMTPSKVRLTESPREILDTDVGSKFTTNSNELGLSWVRLIPRPRIFVTANGTLGPPLSRQDILQSEHAHVPNEQSLLQRHTSQSLKRQHEREDRILRQQRLPRDRHDSSAKAMPQDAVVSNRDAHDMLISDMTRGQVSYPTAAQKMAWDGFLRKILGKNK